MKYRVQVNELRYGEVEVDARSEEQAKAVASKSAINWYDSEIADMTVQDSFDATFEDEDEYIHRQVPTLEILCQLAEEAGELTQAALKLRRALDGTNPTPVGGKAAMDNLIEEFADVLLCGNLLLLPDQRRKMKAVRDKKKARWVARLKAAEAERDDRNYEVTEVCPSCGAEVSMAWDTDTDGFKAFCPHCGGRMMLCDACRHIENDPVICDYDRETDSCQFSRKRGESNA